MTLRAAVVGCGAVGSLYDSGRKDAPPLSHAGAFRAHPALTLVAGADVDAERRRLFEQQWHVRCYADYRELLERERPDVVAVCTWADSHVEVGMAALEAGVKGILCEKPLAASFDRGRALVDACAARGVPLAVNHLRRWDQAHQQVRAFIADGKLGRVQHATIHYVRGIANSGSHIADLLRFFFGEVAWVRAFDRLQESEPDRAYDAYVSMVSGVGATLIGCERGHYDLFEWDIVGTGGRLRIEDLGYRIRAFGLGEHAAFPGVTGFVETPSPIAGTLDQAMLRATDALVRAVTERAPLDDDGCDGLQAMAIVAAIEKSATAGGEKVSLQS